ncbi:MAG: ectonucleotide pyrophosphatase/phosphodiesterase [Candidatus Acidiferrales bacterium]
MKSNLESGWARTAKTIRVCAVLLAVALGGAASGQQISPVIRTEHGPNKAAQEGKPYVVLVSLDGFRYDYAQKYGAPHLLALAARGASAPDGMIPSYPSITFPNHYTIVTGLYPEHHGIVAMNFYDPARKEFYSYSDPHANGDGTWYGGVPLWSLAEQQGMRSACFFWPGSEAEIAGERPEFYLHFNDKFPDDKRIDQVIAWLKLPPAERPHFITLYYSNVDHAGHEFGPNSTQTADAVHHVDELIGELASRLDALQMRTDLIVVSDHGMETEQGDWIDLDQYANLTEFVAAGPLIYPNSEDAAAKAYGELKGASPKFRAYRRSDVPAELHYNSNPRTGDPVVVATGPYMIRAHAPPGSAEIARAPEKGVHGYSPYEMKTMRAIFYAEGPDIRADVKLAPFENVNIYPLIAKILGLQIGPIDGDLHVLEGVLRTPGSRSAGHHRATASRPAAAAPTN